MRVAHLIKVTLLSGAERHLLTLLPALRAQGVESTLIALVEPQKPMDDLAAECEARQIPLRRVVIRRDLDPSLPARLRPILRELRPELLHTHLIHADLYGQMAARLAGVRVVISGRHNDDAFRRRWPMRLLNRVLWRGFKAGIAISAALRDFTIQVEGAPPRKIHVVRYGIDYTPPPPQAVEAARHALRTELNLPDDALLIGCAGRFIAQKGLLYALRAFAQVQADFPAAHLLLAGDGPERAALEAEVKRLNLGERVRFLGWRRDLEAVLAGLDLFLMPSLWEGFGLVLLEAMSRRLPIVASRSSAIPEIVVDGETGLLVPPRDADTLADALRLLLSDRALRLHLGLMGEDRLETAFNAARMAHETHAVYQVALSR